MPPTRHQLLVVAVPLLLGLLVLRRLLVVALVALLASAPINKEWPAPRKFVPIGWKNRVQACPIT